MCLVRHLLGWIVVWALAVGDVAAAPPTGAAARAKPPKPLPSAELADLRAKLLGEDVTTAVTAAQRLGDSGAREAADPLAELLAVGALPNLAVEALQGLEKLRDRKAIQVLTLYSGNRNVPVRKAALRALAALDDPRVAGVLIERLGDSAAEIRTVAAETLADRKEGRAAPRLFKLVAKNDAGAAGPLGTLIKSDDVPRLAELRGRIDDAVLATALGEFLKRPEVADRLRVDVINTLARMPGPAATTALVEYLTSIPEKDNRASRGEAQKLVDARGTP